MPCASPVPADIFTLRVHALEALLSVILDLQRHCHQWSAIRISNCERNQMASFKSNEKKEINGITPELSYIYLVM